MMYNRIQQINDNYVNQQIKEHDYLNEDIENAVNEQDVKFDGFVSISKKSPRMTSFSAKYDSRLQLQLEDRQGQYGEIQYGFTQHG